jgi:hypothetical protein
MDYGKVRNLYLQSNKPRQIPICPSPQRSELLSSWIERTACFYGCDFDHWLAPIQLSLGARKEHSIDIDKNPKLRRSLSSWVGIPLSNMPTALSKTGLVLLPPRARLVFCQICWDEDAASGNQPYVRQIWTHWNTVYCEKHGEFLSAKHTNLDARNDLISWRSVWESRQNWWAPFQLNKRPNFGDAGWYAPGRIAEFHRDRLLTTLRRFHSPLSPTAKQILALSLRPALYRVIHGLVCQTDKSGKRFPRMIEPWESVGWKHKLARPVLLETRIAVLIVASELYRMLERSEPIDVRVRGQLASLLGAKHLSLYEISPHLAGR